MEVDPSAPIRAPRSRRIRIPARLAALAFSVGLSFALSFATTSCLSHRIEVRANDDAAVARAESLFVVVLPLADPGDPGSAVLEPDALRARIERALRAKGHAPAPDAGSGLVLEAEPRVEIVSRKTWTSDTDASAPKVVPGTDLVFALRAVDPEGELKLWNCEARLPLPTSERPKALTADREALWQALVDRALSKIPARRGP